MPNRPKSARASMRRLRRSPAMLKPTPTRASVHKHIDDRHPSNRYQLEHPGSMLERISVRASMFGDARTDGIGSIIHFSRRCPLENRCPAMLKMTSARASMFELMSFRASFETDRPGARADSPCNRYPLEQSMRSSGHWFENRRARHDAVQAGWDCVSSSSILQ